MFLFLAEVLKSLNSNLPVECVCRESAFLRGNGLMSSQLSRLKALGSRGVSQHWRQSSGSPLGGCFHDCVCGGFALSGRQLPAQLLSDSVSSAWQSGEMRKKLMGRGKDKRDHVTVSVTSQAWLGTSFLSPLPRPTLCPVSGAGSGGKWGAGVGLTVSPLFPLHSFPLLRCGLLPWLPCHEGASPCWGVWAAPRAAVRVPALVCPLGGLREAAARAWPPQGPGCRQRLLLLPCCPHAVPHPLLPGGPGSLLNRLSGAPAPLRGSAVPSAGTGAVRPGEAPREAAQRLPAYPPPLPTRL